MIIIGITDQTRTHSHGTGLSLHTGSIKELWITSLGRCKYSLELLQLSILAAARPLRRCKFTHITVTGRMIIASASNLKSALA